MTRKSKSQFVRRGYLVGEGATKSEAKASLDRQIDWVVSAPSPTIESRFGLIILIAASPNGWESKVFDPQELKHGQQQHCSTLHGQNGHYTDILESARVHAAQWSWNHDADDDAHITAAGLGADKARELQGWINFQRKHAALLLAGHTPAEAFNLANR